MLHIQLCSFPTLGHPPQAALGHLGLSPCPSACRERCCSCPGCGRDRVQCFLTGEGRFVPASASFPCLSPVYLHPWLQQWNVPGAARSHLRPGSCLLPVPPQAAPVSQPSHSSSCPGKARPFQHGHGVLVSFWWSCWAPSPGAGAGRTFLQAGILPGHGTSIISTFFPSLNWRILGWGLPVSRDVPGKVLPCPATPWVWSEPVLAQGCHRLPRHPRFGWVVRNDCNL